MCLEEIETIRNQVFKMISDTGNLIGDKKITDEEAAEMKENTQQVQKRIMLITERCNEEFERYDFSFRSEAIIYLQ